MDGAKVVLIRRYNAPSIHRPDCRHAGYPGAGRDLVTLTDAMREHVLDGWLKACGTCKPTEDK